MSMLTADTVNTPVEVVMESAPQERKSPVGVRIITPDTARAVYMYDDTESALTRVRAAVRNATHWPDQIDDLMLMITSGLVGGTSVMNLNDWEILVTVDPSVIAKIETF